MAKYKVGDIFINHNDGKILQVCEGLCDKGCAYPRCWNTSPFSKDISCTCLIGALCHVEEAMIKLKLSMSRNSRKMVKNTIKSISNGKN